LDWSALGQLDEQYTRLFVATTHLPMMKKSKQFNHFVESVQPQRGPNKIERKISQASQPDNFK
jgi:hypothetical protein